MLKRYQVEVIPGVNRSTYYIVDTDQKFKRIATAYRDKQTADDVAEAMNLLADYRLWKRIQETAPTAFFREVEAVDSTTG